MLLMFRIVDSNQAIVHGGSAEDGHLQHAGLGGAARH